MLPFSVLDTETTIRNVGEKAVGDFAGSPFCPDNFIVSMGELHHSGECKAYYDTEGVKVWPWAFRNAMAGHKTMLVGHNIGFDLHYLHKMMGEDYEKALPYLYIWDTQQVEYLLSGQSEMYPSLDQCCEKRGLPTKIPTMKQYWEAGIDTVHHPKEELLEYMEGDVRNTYAVFLDQWEQVMANSSLRELVFVKMDDLLCTIEMTWNGMRFDLETAQDKLRPLDEEHKELYNMIVEEGKRLVGEDFSPTSGDDISLLLFGGHQKVTVDQPQLDETGQPIRYKGGQKQGQIRTKKTDILVPVKGYGISADSYGIPKLKRGFYSTDSEYLEKVEHPLVQHLLRFRELEKDIGTYYLGYSKFVWFDGCIHPRINQESTRTGRQSCSDPNLQNTQKDNDG